MLCGARARTTGKLCQNVAGKGTDHTGVGRCKFHGGATPVASGRYSRITRPRIAELIAQFEADPDPLNIFAELAATRALFQDYIERYDQFAEALLAWHASWGKPEINPKPRQVLDIASAGALLQQATQIVERIEKMRSANAISQPELYRVMGEMGRIVTLYVTDEKVLGKIRDGWMQIRLQPNR